MADDNKSSVPQAEKQEDSSTAKENVIEENMEEIIAQADKGSTQHQVQLGTHFLKLAESDINREENAIKAVSWFILASKHGSEAATEKLRHCVDTNTGITDKNKSDVTWCLNTAGTEKKIRYAAKSLFSSLSPAHSGALSKDEYIEAINKLTAGHEKERKLLLAAGKKIGSTISENDFVKIVSKKIQGTLTLTADEMDETTAAYDSAGILKKILVYPRQTAQIAFDRGLEYASKEGLNIVLSLIPTNQIYLLALLFLYSYLTPGFFLFVVPLMAFYISMLVLLISTLQMFYRKRKRKDATTLATMLQQQFDMDIDVDSTESQYSWNSLTPYFLFFATLPIVVISFSLANRHYIPCAELFVISNFMTGFCFLALADNHDILTLFALGSHAFAALPIFLSDIPKIPFLTKAVELLTRPFFSLPLGLGVSFNLSLPALVHMLVPLLLFRIAMKAPWSGIPKILIPHLVCYFWFSLATTTFPFTTWGGIARATVGYLLLPVMVPLSLFASILGIFYMFYKLMQTEMVGKLVVTGLLLAVPILLSQTKAFVGKSKEKESAKAQKIKKYVMISFAVLGVLPLLFVRLPSLLDKKSLALSWEDYKELCIPDNDIWAPYQIRCRDFIGTKVQWKGVVDQVKVSKVENTAESAINALPTILSEPLSCIYGDRYSECDTKTMSAKAFKHCQLVKSTGKSCHLHGHNQVTLILSVKVDGNVLSLEASPHFYSRVIALEPGDQLEFSGSLADVGTPSPNLKLKSLNCTSRVLPAMMQIEDDVDEDSVLRMISEALGLTFNFSFFPVLSYSPE